MNRNFNEWLATFRDSINRYDYYTDFAKVYENASKLKVQIYILNSLVCSENIEQEFEKLLTEYPECLKAVPILLAVRQSELFCRDDNGEFIYNFDEPNQSVEQYKYFMRKTGLFDLLQKHIISNLYDYVTGVEVGLDSNGRKNRGGHQMENLVEKFLIAAGVEYFKEKYDHEVEKMFGLDLSAITANRTSTKRFDFVVKTANKVLGIETNFYTSGGSKLNETARSYKTIALESKNIDSFEFVWITDGKGWKSTRKNLKETFLVLPTLYNIRDLENGIFSELFKVK
ncbi:MAG: type II restriction endonuclease [Selenomonadaceae bacterium]|nr:type II restriction endonuclease [Selenomonadaceae bacterium]